jgi:cytochrome c
MKKTIVIFSSALLMMACGSSGDSKTGSKDSVSTSASPTVSAADEKGLELIGASDCTTCHKLDKSSTTGIAIGPAYSDVAAKYAPAADTTIDRLVKKVISGGSGIWGTVPMTPHAALKESDVREMVKYILTLKK